MHFASVCIRVCILSNSMNWSVAVEYFPAWWRAITAATCGRVNKCAQRVTCGCPHLLLSLGWRWWKGWFGNIGKVTSCVLLSNMYLHLEVLYAFVLLQQRQTYLWLQGIVVHVHHVSLKYVMGMGQKDMSFLPPDLVTQQTRWNACDTVWCTANTQTRTQICTHMCTVYVCVSSSWGSASAYISNLAFWLVMFLLFTIM